MHTQELFTLFIITATLFGILTILLVYLMIRKSVALKKRKAMESFKEKINPNLFEMLTEDSLSRKLNPGSPVEKNAMEELLSRYARILEGEQEKKRLTELAETFLSDYYRKRMKSKRWSQRMNALYHIEEFKMKQLQNDVLLLTNKKSLTTEETVHVLRILALFQFPQIFSLLTDRFFALAEYNYRSILIRLEATLFEQFLLSFHKVSQPLQKAILDVISIKKDFSYLSFIENIFSSYSGEVKLRALKTLAEVGYVKNSKPYKALLYSSKWQERMMAAKLIGALKEETGLPRLIELLHDQSWWVRSQAGQAIYQFPNGKGILRSVLETSNDAFAKDMAWEWLHKGV
jgi:hypothetical protein